MSKKESKKQKQPFVPPVFLVSFVLRLRRFLLGYSWETHPKGKIRNLIATQVYKACRETLSNKTTEQPLIGIFAKSASLVAFQKYSIC